MRLQGEDSEGCSWGVAAESCENPSWNSLPQRWSELRTAWSLHAYVIKNSIKSHDISSLGSVLCSTCTLFPDQPVADLELYMVSMEKKKESIEKMVKTLSTSKEDGPQKSFNWIWWYACSKPASLYAHIYVFIPGLISELKPLDASMSTCYERFSAFLTELKLEHKDGKTPEWTAQGVAWSLQLEECKSKSI